MTLMNAAEMYYTHNMELQSRSTGESIFGCRRVKIVHGFWDSGSIISAERKSSALDWKWVDGKKRPVDDRTVAGEWTDTAVITLIAFKLHEQWGQLLSIEGDEITSKIRSRAPIVDSTFVPPRFYRIGWKSREENRFPFFFFFQTRIAFHFVCCRFDAISGGLLVMVKSTQSAPFPWIKFCAQLVSTWCERKISKSNALPRLEADLLCECSRSLDRFCILFVFFLRKFFHLLGTFYHV